MRKSKVECSIELDFFNGEIVLLGAHDRDQVHSWLLYVQKAMKFTDWFSSVKSVLKANGAGNGSPGASLSDQIVYKLT